MSLEILRSDDQHLKDTIDGETWEIQVNTLIHLGFHKVLKVSSDAYLDELLHTRPTWVSADRRFVPNIVDTRVKLPRQFEIAGIKEQGYDLDSLAEREQSEKGPYVIWVRDHPINGTESIKEARGRLDAHEEPCSISEVTAWYLQNSRRIRRSAVIVSSTRNTTDDGEHGYLGLRKLYIPVWDWIEPSPPKLTTLKDRIKLPRRAVLLSRLR